MRLTSESDCVVSFVGASSQHCLKGGGVGGERVEVTYCSTNWLSRIGTSYQNQQHKKKKQHYRIGRNRERSREGGGGVGMLVRYLIEIFRTVVFLVRQVLSLTKRKVSVLRTWSISSLSQVIEYQAVRYPICPLSLSLEAQLRKTDIIIY